MYKFEKLKVRQNSVALVENIYQFCNQLPPDEKFALTSQLKRSAASVVLNIAEGTGSLGDVEFKSFLRIVVKSLYETVATVKLAEKLFTVNGEEILVQCDLVGKQLNGLINSLKTKDQSPIAGSGS